MVRKKRSLTDNGLFSTTPFKLPKNTFPNIGTTQPKRDARRAFGETQKKEILAKQDHKCAKCHKKLGVAYHFHHIKSWSSGGKTTVENGRALCGTCHEEISHKERLKKSDKKRTTRDSNPFSNIL